MRRAGRPDDRTVEIVADGPALAEAAAKHFVRHAEEAIEARGQLTVALAGGTTPNAMYERLATAFRDAVPWHAIHFFWGDERYVPPTHPDSNFRAAYDAMLSKVPAPETHIHRVHTELSNAADAAADYQRTLRREFALNAAALPAFDLVLLGVGADGHTASLFPGSDALRRTDRLVLAPWVEKFQAHRITLSLPVLNQALLVVLMVSGAAKADVLHAVLEGPERPDALPAQAVRPSNGRVLWLVDRPAAAKLCVAGATSQRPAQNPRADPA